MPRLARRLASVGSLLLMALLVPASLLAQSGQVVEYYHLDALGSVRAVSNQQGEIISRHEYLPFGEEWIPGTPQRENKLYTGKEHDPETTFDYFGARYYDARVGRFTTIDPVYTWQDNLTDPQRWNRYAYVRNNPLKYVDPEGRTLELPADKDERMQFLNALKEAVGEGAAKLMSVRYVAGRFYAVVSDMKAFAEGGEVARKIGGIISDPSRTASLRFGDEGARIGGDSRLGPGGGGGTPGVLDSRSNTVWITNGQFGAVPMSLMEDFNPGKITLALLLAHELGHVDADWYHQGQNSNFIAVWTENQLRARQRGALRTGHDSRYDIYRR